MADDEEHLGAAERPNGRWRRLEGVRAGPGRQDQDNLGAGTRHAARDVVEREDGGGDFHSVTARPGCREGDDQ
jgi:hypothetical protein